MALARKNTTEVCRKLIIQRFTIDSDSESASETVLILVSLSLPFFAVAEERNDGGLRSDTRTDALHRVAGRLTGEPRTLINSIKILISFHMMIIHNYPQHEHLCPQATLVRNGEAVKIIEPHKPNRPVSLQNCQWLCVLGFRLIMNHLLANICRSSSNLQTAVRHRNVPYPHFQDEKERIERLGGSVVHWGTWRVNGQLAVSRAIGE